MGHDFTKVSEDGKVTCHQECRDEILKILPRLVKVVRCLAKIVDQYGKIAYIRIAEDPKQRQMELLFSGFKINYSTIDRANLVINQEYRDKAKEQGFVFSLWSDKSSLANWSEQESSQISWFVSPTQWLDDLEKAINNLFRFGYKKEAEFFEASRKTIKECKKIMAE